MDVIHLPISSCFTLKTSLILYTYFVSSNLQIFKSSTAEPLSSAARGAFFDTSASAYHIEIPLLIEFRSPGKLTTDNIGNGNIHTLATFLISRLPLLNSPFKNQPKSDQNLHPARVPAESTIKTALFHKKPDLQAKSSLFLGPHPS